MGLATDESRAMTIATCRSPVLLAILMTAVAGCEAAPRDAPIRVGEVETGPGSLQFVRHQLSGTWEIVSYAYTDSDGRAVDQEAAGTMTYDEFGNLAVSAVIGSSSGEPDRSVDYTTRVVIDTVNECIHLAESEQLMQTDLPDALDPARPRFYIFEDDLLRLSVRENGRETATLVWKKRPGGPA